MAISRFAVGQLCLWGLGLAIVTGLAPSATCGQLTVVVQPVIAGSATVTNAFLNNEELYATTIFDQIGLALDFLSPISDSTVPTSYDGTVSNEPQQYFGSSSFQSLPILTVWFVSTITNAGISDRGLSQNHGTTPASWIATTGSATAANDTLAHEIANDLDGLQETTGHSTFLEEVGTDRTIPSSLSQVFPTGSDDQITSAQATRILGTLDFVQDLDTPEPGTFALGGLGILLMVAIPRLRARHREHSAGL
jgi:hypothetical protein